VLILTWSDVLSARSAVLHRPTRGVAFVGDRRLVIHKISFQEAELGPKDTHLQHRAKLQHSSGQRMTLSRKTHASLARVMTAAIIATALMLLVANAMLIGHSVYKIVLLGDIADLEQRWIARYTPMRSLMVGVWGIACGLSAGIAAWVAHRAFPPPLRAEQDRKPNSSSWETSSNVGAAESPVTIDKGMLNVAQLSHPGWHKLEEKGRGSQPTPALAIPHDTLTECDPLAPSNPRADEKSLRGLLTFALNSPPDAAPGIEGVNQNTVLTTQSTLAQYLGCSKTSVHDQLKQLQHWGLLKFKGDGRRTRISEIHKLGDFARYGPIRLL
jgi:hypothetical protein